MRRMVETDRMSEARVALRWMAHLQQGGSAIGFAAAGEVLAVAVSRTESFTLPPWAELLAEAMSSSLMSVLHQTRSAPEGVLRVRLAMAASTLAVVLHKAVPKCRHAIAIWMARIPPPQWMDDLDALTARTLLALYLDDVKAASDCVGVLRVARPSAERSVLDDWVRARLSGDIDEESHCFRRLQDLSAGTLQEGEEASLTLLAALTVVTRISELRFLEPEVPERRYAMAG